MVFEQRLLVALEVLAARPAGSRGLQPGRGGLPGLLQGAGLGAELLDGDVTFQPQVEQPLLLAPYLGDPLQPGCLFHFR
jgi:hypothetical protein